MVEKYQDIIDFMLQDPDWEVPMEKRAAMVASIPQGIIHG